MHGDGAVRYQRASAVFDAPLHDGVMVLNTQAGRFHGLDGTGAAIWAALVHPHTLSELVERLHGLYVVDRDTCQRDVAHFLGELVARGLVSMSGEGTPNRPTPVA